MGVNFATRVRIPCEYPNCPLHDRYSRYDHSCTRYSGDPVCEFRANPAKPARIWEPACESVRIPCESGANSVRIAEYRANLRDYARSQPEYPTQPGLDSPIAAELLEQAFAAAGGVEKLVAGIEWTNDACVQKKYPTYVLKALHVCFVL